MPWFVDRIPTDIFSFCVFPPLKKNPPFRWLRSLRASKSWGVWWMTRRREAEINGTGKWCCWWQQFAIHRQSPDFPVEPRLNPEPQAGSCTDLSRGVGRWDGRPGRTRGVWKRRDDTAFIGFLVVGRKRFWRYYLSISFLKSTDGEPVGAMNQVSNHMMVSSPYTHN